MRIIGVPYKTRSAKFIAYDEIVEKINLSTKMYKCKIRL